MATIEMFYRSGAVFHYCGCGQWVCIVIVWLTGLLELRFFFGAWQWCFLDWQRMFGQWTLVCIVFVWLQLFWQLVWKTSWLQLFVGQGVQEQWVGCW